MFKTFLKFSLGSMKEASSFFMWLLMATPFLMVYVTILTIYARFMWFLIKSVWHLF